MAVPLPSLERSRAPMTRLFVGASAGGQNRQSGWHWRPGSHPHKATGCHCARPTRRQCGAVAVFIGSQALRIIRTRVPRIVNAANGPKLYRRNW